MKVRGLINLSTTNNTKIIIIKFDNNIKKFYNKMTWKENIIDIIEKNNLDLGYFTIQDLYIVSLDKLNEIYPSNNTIKDSIRGTLQKLRDDNYLCFISKGKYKVISNDNNDFIEFIEKYHKK